MKKEDNYFKNFIIAKKVSIVAGIISVIIIIDYVLGRFVLHVPVVELGATAFIFPVLIPFGNVWNLRMELKKRNEIITLLDVKTRLHGNPTFNKHKKILLTYIISNFIPFIYLFLICFFEIFFHLIFNTISINGSIAYETGYFSIPYILCIVANVFLIKNYLLLNRKYKEEYYKNKKEYEEKIRIIKAEKEKQEALLAEKQKCKDLIETCGIKFFIKYYDQIKFLPLRDVQIEENYPYEERVERITATKRIIELHPSNSTLYDIIFPYYDYLTQKEKDRVESLLKKIE